MTATMITVAPTGSKATRAKTPTLPVTLEEIVGAAGSAQHVGASAVHVHVRNERAAPTFDLGRLRETVAALRRETDLIVELSTGGSVTDSEEDRLRVLDAEPDAASCAIGTVKSGDDIFGNRWDFLVTLHERMRDREIVPAYQVYDLIQLAALQRLLDRHGPPFGEHVHCVLVMGMDGGMPGTIDALVAAARLLPAGATFSATGLATTAIPVMLATLSAGGHLRVGMEDTLDYAEGEPVRDNGHFVARAVGLAKIAQRPPMMVEDARALLGIRDRRVAAARG